MPLTLLTLPAQAQRSSAADVGFTYRVNEVGRSPYFVGPGTARLTDGRTLEGQMRLHRKRNPILIVEDPIRQFPGEQVAALTIDGHQYLPISATHLDLRNARQQVVKGWVEVLKPDSTGSAFYELRTDEPAVHSTGVDWAGNVSIHFYVVQLKDGRVLKISTQPPRGYSQAFEDTMRSILADRPDLLKFIDGHYLTIYNLVDVLRALDTGGKMKFK